jgi:hypothetical protein
MEIVVFLKTRGRLRVKRSLIFPRHGTLKIVHQSLNHQPSSVLEVAIDLHLVLKPKVRLQRRRDPEEKVGKKAKPGEALHGLLETWIQKESHLQDH